MNWKRKSRNKDEGVARNCSVLGCKLDIVYFAPCTVQLLKGGVICSSWSFYQMENLKCGNSSLRKKLS